MNTRLTVWRVALYALLTVTWPHAIGRLHAQTDLDAGSARPLDAGVPAAFGLADGGRSG